MNVVLEVWEAVSGRGGVACRCLWHSPCYHNVKVYKAAAQITPVLHLPRPATAPNTLHSPLSDTRIHQLIASLFAAIALALLPLALAKPVPTTTATPFPIVAASSTLATLPPFATTTDTPDVPQGAVFWDPPKNSSRGQRIHPIGRSDLCLAVQQEDNQVKSGAAIGISYCHANEDPYSVFELWDLPAVQWSDRYVTLNANKAQVLDAVNGKLVLNEVGIHDQGQKWAYSVKGYFAVDGKCITFDSDSKPDGALPWGKVRDLTAEECVGGAPDQVFYWLPFQEDYVNYD